MVIGQTAIECYASHISGFKFTILGSEFTKYQNYLLREVVSVNGTTVQRRSFAATSPAAGLAAAAAASAGSAAGNLEVRSPH